MPYLLIDRHGYHESVNLPKENLLKSLYSELRCSLIEIAPTIYRGYILIIDEEGKLSPYAGFSRNRYADVLYRYSELNGYDDWIARDAILAKSLNGDIQPLTQEEIIRFRREIDEGVE